MRKILPLIISLLILTGCAREKMSSVYTQTKPVMNTFVQVKVVLSRGQSKLKTKLITNKAFLLAEDLDKRISVFNPKSEVNALNISKKRKVSNELFSLLREANRISDMTGGKFDITVAPILKREGFYKDMPKEILGRIPSGSSGVGWENVVLSDDGKTVSLKKGAWIDLSGIAKGYIVDELAGFLEKEGIEKFLINAGGDIYCSEKASGEAWNVGIRQPGAQFVLAEMPIKNAAIATSGDYENTVLDISTGEAVSHIVDPARKEAIKEKSSSVTVIASTCAEADALATAFMVTQTEEVREIAEKLGNVTVITAYKTQEGEIVTDSFGPMSGHFKGK